MKLHIRDIRLYNNAGMSFPVCCRNAELLDLDKSGWSMLDMRSMTWDEVVSNPNVCKNCIRSYHKRYPWARG